MTAAFNGIGLLAFDWALVFILFLAAISATWFYFLSIKETSFLFKTGLILSGFGWILWATRFTIELLSGGDPQVSPLGLISITCIASGTILSFMLGKIK